ncbi:DUF3800 domain-containing protein [Mucilaginibacter sp. HC2]|uniref:DUF3800 domain-containing protein n=1 Tax=Mucilaginibacter inviolabilis TaxID=2714892 RepID=UPI00140967A0|nr:DUF3800 domain-containing protein [Mucilaginibacter inviolabilis]NHA04905.1 DUF3800 domain-containing protein [Mucilaginibacter inviolabilis]
MGNFYIDGSVHDDAGFTLCACVYAPSDLDHVVTELMKACKLDPNEFEYKSSANYSKQPELVEFRSKLKEIFQQNCHYGVVILPRDKRDKAGQECLLAINQFIKANSQIELPLSIFMDQGLFPSENVANKLFDELKIKDTKFFAEQDSKQIRGIQVADLVAHMASIQLKSAMGLINKMVKAGENSGYDPEGEMELSFEMFGTLRYYIFNEGNNKPPTGDQFIDAVMTVGKAGLFISEYCSADLADSAQGTFGTIYLGCIH